MKKNLKSRKNIDLDELNMSCKKDLKGLISENEKYYSNQIKEIMKDITNPKSNIKLLLIAGPSSAGKTTTSNLLQEELSIKKIPSVVISLDNFFINRDVTPKLPNGNYDYENITCLDLDYLNKFIDALLITHKAKMPTFDFYSGKRGKIFTDITITDKTIVIIEGLHALNPKLIKHHKKESYKVYLSLNSNYIKDGKIITTAKEIRLIRRITRDYYNRGYSPLETLSTWKTVCDGENKWIKPFKATANYIIDSVHEYEMLLYSKYTRPILKKLILEKNVKTLLNKESELTKKTYILNKIKKAKEIYLELGFSIAIGKESIPPASLLWEFVGSAKSVVEPSGKIFEQ